jgi:hypothetical protein
MATPSVCCALTKGILAISNQSKGAQTSIVQSLTYFEHLSEPMAEFLHILSEQYDYTQLGDEILRCEMSF